MICASLAIRSVINMSAAHAHTNVFVKFLLYESIVMVLRQSAIHTLHSGGFINSLMFVFATTALCSNCDKSAAVADSAFLLNSHDVYSE